MVTRGNTYLAKNTLPFVVIQSAFTLLPLTDPRWAPGTRAPPLVVLISFIVMQTYYQIIGYTPNSGIGAPAPGPIRH